ncbi:MAG: alpha-N-arabinofuranosidase [Lachnospiraceae bacterium]|nr:alpha-N-arabinofuranosidase [Lachnospiraceae bacterium]
MYKLYINPQNKKGHLNRELQGHFSEHLGRCIYEGIYVGENSSIPNENGMRKDVVEALKKLQIPVLRWPGGCFADEYHWMDGVGPKENRKKMINTHWGGVMEDNSFGTEEYMELCRQLGCKTYVNGNMGSGTVREMSEWVEYMTLEGTSPMADMRKNNGHEAPYRLDYFGVGNESWGCGGNMLPEYYANEYRRYQTYVRTYDWEKPVYKIACGPNAEDYEWTEVLMKLAGGHMSGLSLHYYTVPTGDWNKKGSATEFDKKDWYQTLKKTLYMEELLSRHSAIMDKYDKEKRVGLIVDEWGTWYDCEPGTNPGFLYQQNTMRDALVAAINLNLFNKHCDRVHMANIAQLVNVLQAVILTEGEQMLLTPTYHVFDLYKCHQDGELLDSFLETKEIGEEDAKVPNLTESVSLGTDGKIHITLGNLSLDESYEIEGILAETGIKSAKGRILSGQMQDHNTFENPHKVQTHIFEQIECRDNRLNFAIPPCSVLELEIEMA